MRVPLILSKRTNYGIQDEDGNLSGHYFAMLDKDLPLRIHLNFGLDPSVQNNEGKTPLHIAAEKGFERVVAVIICGREVNIKTFEGNCQW